VLRVVWGETRGGWGVGFEVQGDVIEDKGLTAEIAETRFLKRLRVSDGISCLIWPFMAHSGYEQKVMFGIGGIRL